MEDFQDEIYDWMVKCFGKKIADNKSERNFRFIEESLELVQAAGMTKQQVLKLVDYTFNRPKGEVDKEIGGVMVTLGALAIIYNRSISDCGYKELDRIWKSIDKIRDKQSNKPTEIKDDV